MSISSLLGILFIAGWYYYWLDRRTKRMQKQLDDLKFEVSFLEGQVGLSESMEQIMEEREKQREM